MSAIAYLDDYRRTQPIPLLAPATVELPIWSGQPPIRTRSTSHARPSLLRRVVRSPLAADVQRHRFAAWACVSAAVSLGLSIVGAA